MIVTRNKRSKNKQVNMYLNNKILAQNDKLKYLGITIDNTFKLNKHIDNVSDKCLKLIHALAKSAKLN